MFTEKRLLYVKAVNYEKQWQIPWTGLTGVEMQLDKNRVQLHLGLPMGNLADRPAAG